MDHLLGHGLGHLQAVRVDVHQADGGARQGGALENVADQRLGEDNRPGTDKRDLGVHEVRTILADSATGRQWQDVT